MAWEMRGSQPTGMSMRNLDNGVGFQFLLINYKSFHHVDLGAHRILSGSMP